MPQQDDDYGFWDGDRAWSRTGPIPRVSRQPANFDAPAPLRRERPAPARKQPQAPNLFLRRIGALVALGVIAAPIALAVGGSGSSPRVRSEVAAEQGAATVLNTVAAADGVVPVVPDVSAVAPSAVDVTVAAIAETPITAAAEPTTEAVVETPASVDEPAPPSSVAELKSNTQTADNVAATTTGGRGSLVANSATALAQSAPACAKKYKVAAGDYWILVARKTAVKLADLLSVNNATVATPLYPGRTICLPKNATSPTTTSTTVKATTTTTKATTPTTVKPKAATPTTVKPKAPTTTAPPAPTTTTMPPPPKNTYSRAAVEQIIRSIWPDDLEDEALRIATRESNLIPTVRNSCCFGLFQIHFQANKSSLLAWGITSATQLYDPQVNAYAAYAMYLRAGGWGPWKL